MPILSTPRANLIKISQLKNKYRLSLSYSEVLKNNNLRISRCCVGVIDKQCNLYSCNYWFIVNQTPSNTNSTSNSRESSIKH